MSFVLFIPHTAWKKVALLFVLTCVALPSFVSAATLGFSPRERTYEVGSTITVAVQASSGDLALNAVSGTISFPKDLLSVQSISKSRSIISLWVQEPTYSNTSGTVQFEGIVLNPGYSGANGTVVTVTFLVRAAGVANLSFPNGSILANDGSGSEILSGRGSATFTLTPKQALSDVDVEIGEAQGEQIQNLTETVGAPKVTQDAVGRSGWSAEQKQTFTFSYDSSVTALRLLLDQKSDSIPTVVYQPPILTKEISDLPEGVSYLHVQTKNGDGWSAIMHHPISIDTTLPELTVSELQSPHEEIGIKVFELKGVDSLSGIERFEILLDGVVTETFTSAGIVTYITPILTPGQHALVVRTFDQAGNVTEKSSEFTIAETSNALTATPENETPVSFGPLLASGTTLITMLSIVIPTLALVFLMGGLLLYGVRVYKKYKQYVSLEVAEAQAVTMKVFDLLKNDLETDIQLLQKASKKRTLTKEELKLLKHLAQNIEGAQKIITDEIQDIIK